MSKTFFFIHNLGSRYASNSIKGSVDVDFSLVSKKALGQRNYSLG